MRCLSIKAFFNKAALKSTLVLLLLSSAIHAQVLLDPAGDGGFQNGTTFASNNWLTSNASASLGWFTGTLSSSAGGRGAYISHNSGTGLGYGINLLITTIHYPGTSHLYRNFTVPSGATNITLSYKWRAGGQAGVDYMNTYVVAQSYNPVGSTTHLSTMPPAGNLVAGPHQLQNTFQTTTVTLNNSIAGIPQRLVFTWTNNNATGTYTLGGVIDEVSITYTAACNNPTVPTIVQGASVTRCAGDPPTALSITGGTLNDATTWQWYSGSCGGTAVGTGTSIGVSPTTTTTYFVRGTGGCVSGGTCASVTVNVNQPPAVTTHPTANTNICSGGTLNLSAAASNVTGYQWYFNGGPIAPGSPGVTGESSQNLQITGVTAAHAGTYHVVVTGTSPCASVQSNNAVVVVNQPVNITTQPLASLAQCEGNILDLNVIASNAGGYQWFGPAGQLINGVNNVGGATTADLSIAPCALTDIGTYYVIVSGMPGCPDVNSLTSNVIVNEPVSITTQPVLSTTQCSGSPVSINIDAANAAGYQWYGPGGQLADGGSISGSLLNTLTISPVSSAEAGTYYVALQGLPGCSDLNSDNSEIIVNEPISITTQPPVTLVSCSGTGINLTVADNGSVAGYQWYGPGGQLADGGSISGSSLSTLTISPVSAAEAGMYYVQLQALPACADMNSDNSEVIVNEPITITTQPQASLGVCDGTSINLSVADDGNGTGYQWYKDGQPLADNASISGSLTTGLTVANSGVADQGTYHVEITGNTPCPTESSTDAIVTTEFPIAITSQPVSLSACSGVGALMNVVVTGTNPAYTWFNGVTQLSTDALYTVNNDQLTINNSIGLDGNMYHVVISGNCGSPVTSNAAMLTEDFDNTWSGAVDNLWSNTANWSCGILPTSATNVIIPNVPNAPIVNIPTAVCNNLTINTGALVSFNGTINKLSIYGDVQNNGLFSGSNGTIALVGTTAQQVSGPVIYDGLEIDGGSAKIINGSATVNGELILTDGFLELGNNDLTITDMAAQTTGSNASYVVTNGSGTVIGQNMGSALHMFHVGISETSYTPIAIENIGDADTFRVRVMPNVYMDGDGTNPDEVINPVVDRTWMVSEQTAGGSIAHLSPYWSTIDEINAFDIQHVYVAHYMGGEWTSDIDSAIDAPAAVPAGVLWTTTEDSITSFSPFAVASYGQFPLGISLTSIAATNAGPRNKVEWKSATESASGTYELERSTDAKRFIKIATIATNGKPSSYLQWDENPSQGVNYYRVKLIDAAGKFSYSKVVTATVNATNNFAIEAYPNPVHNIVSVKVSGEVKGKGSVIVTDLTGKVVTTSALVENNSAELNVNHLANGMYLLNYTDDVRNESIKINKQ